VHAKVHAVLGRIARRLLDEYVDLLDKESRGSLSEGERERLEWHRKDEASKRVSDAERKHLSDCESLRIRTDTTDA
jgi:hypothetical protein